MPAFYTHHYFANNCYNHMKESTKKGINKDYFLAFSQSFDYLFYKNGISKRSKLIRKLGHTAHHQNTQAFFINLIQEILNKQNDKDCSYYLSFLYGSLTHYILDSTFHPYIFYKTGVFKKEDKRTYKYNGLHTKYELLLDKYYYQKEHNVAYHKARLYKIYDKVWKVPASLKSLIDNVFKKTYHKDDVGKEYIKCMKNHRWVVKHIKRDPFKIKYFIYSLVDKISGSRTKNIRYYSSYIKDDFNNILNNDHLKWKNPALEELEYNYNIDELYNMALKKYEFIYSKIDDVLTKKEDIRSLAKYLPNISYISGLDISSNLRVKFFEF